jgi:hypothetical protein
MLKKRRNLLSTNTGSTLQRNWIYITICAASALLFLLLYSSGMAEFMNTTLVSFQTDQVVDGIKSSGTTLGEPSYTAWALRDNAGFFVNLPLVAQFVLTYLVMALLALAVLDGISRRSFALSFTPVFVAFVVTLFIQTDFIPFDRLIAIVTGALMGIAVLDALRRNFNFAAVRRSNAVIETPIRERDPLL